MPYLITKELPVKEPIPGFKGRFVHSDNMTVVHWRISANSMAPKHAHPHEQVTLVVEGEFELTIAGEKKVLKPGVVALVPPSIEHMGIALTDCHLIDIFYPVREDYR